MKSILKFLTFSIVATIVLVACSKNQRVVRQLEGDWTLSAMSYNGIPEDMSGESPVTYSFTKCRVKKGPCDGSLSSYDVDKGGELTINFTYDIEDKGEKITIVYDFFGIQETEVGKIKEHSKDKFIYEVEDTGDVTTFTLTKK